MKWGFVLVTLYMGPIGLLLYVMADKEPQPGAHEEFVKPLWKQGVGSTIHCVAGDATGIILAAVVTATLGLPMWIDLIVEYMAGFSFGLFIFQSLFIKNMMGGTYWDNVKKSFMPEFISMNAMMAGMAPVMTLLMMGRDMRAMEPTELLFWGVMSLGVIAGFAVTYPVNFWMVSRRIKHGLMTQREEAHAPGIAADDSADKSAKATSASPSQPDEQGTETGMEPGMAGMSMGGKSKSEAAPDTATATQAARAKTAVGGPAAAGDATTRNGRQPSGKADGGRGGHTGHGGSASQGAIRSSPM